MSIWTPKSEKTEWVSFEKVVATTVVDQVDYYRRLQNLTVEMLCKRLDEEGWPISISTMNGLFGKKRGSISLSEIYLFARVLAVPPMLLMVPLAKNDDVETSPFMPTQSAFSIAKWISGASLWLGPGNLTPPRASTFYKEMLNIEMLQEQIVNMNAQINAFAVLKVDLLDVNLEPMSRALFELERWCVFFQNEGVRNSVIRPSLLDWMEKVLHHVRAGNPIHIFLPIPSLNYPAERSHARLLTETYLSGSIVDRAIARQQLQILRNDDGAPTNTD